MAEGIFRKDQAGSMLAAGVIGALVGMTPGAGEKPATPAAPTAPATTTEPTVQILRPPKAAVSLAGGRGAVHLTLVKRARDGRVRAYHTFTDRLGRRVGLELCPREFDLKQDAITALTITIEGQADPEGPIDGNLMLVASDETAAAQAPVSIVPWRAPAYENRLLLIGALAGLFSVIIGGVYALFKFSWKICMRDVVWASNSWATNTTMASGVLAALLVFVSTNDARTLLSQADYKFLIAVFGALALLAPVLFNAIRKTCADGTTKGISLGFVLSSGATMIATQLQLVLLLSMVNDLHLAATLSTALLRAIQGVLVLVMVAFLFYGN